MQKSVSQNHLLNKPWQGGVGSHQHPRHCQDSWHIPPVVKRMSRILSAIFLCRHMHVSSYKCQFIFVQTPLHFSQFIHEFLIASSPGPSQLFSVQCAILKSWEGPGDEAKFLISLETKNKGNMTCYFKI